MFVTAPNNEQWHEVGPTLRVTFLDDSGLDCRMVPIFRPPFTFSLSFFLGWDLCALFGSTYVAAQGLSRGVDCSAFFPQ